MRLSRHSATTWPGCWGSSISVKRPFCRQRDSIDSGRGSTPPNGCYGKQGRAYLPALAYSLARFMAPPLVDGCADIGAVEAGFAVPYRAVSIRNDPENADARHVLQVIHGNASLARCVEDNPECRDAGQVPLFQPNGIEGDLAGKCCSFFSAVNHRFF